MSELVIRKATLEDAEALLKIYTYYVEKTVITFEYEVPSIEEFRGRIENTLKKYPYLVAEADGEIVGYAYAGVFKGRAAYDWAVETTIYLKNGVNGRGYGRKLYEALEEALKKMGILNLYACIGYPEENDEYLTKNSAEFHEHMGYKLIGQFNLCGFKFNRWYHMIWMEKMLGEHREDQAPVRFGEWE